MLIAVIGSDSYLAKTAIDKIKEKYLLKNPEGVELLTVDCDEVGKINWADLAAAPLFTSTRLIIIKRLGSLASDARGELAHFVGLLPPTTVVVAWDDKMLADSLGRVLAAADKVIEAKPLGGAKLERWLQRAAKAKGISLEDDEPAALLKHYGNNLWALSTHLEQRSLSKDVALAGRAFAGEEPFRLHRLVRSGNWSGVSRQMRRDYDRGLPYELIVGTLAAALRQLPRPESYASLVGFLFDLDFAVKTGLIDSASAVALIVSSLPTGRQNGVQWKSVYNELYA